ncbi:hypothetical protein F0562_031475 [Nyssa sinensis]|uniref:Uncharacterized protein n=1 Tax=Nyssa sinensis TaxID=561372 RepID=A0A5J5AUB9_9ASTE|nr:hypothetical protein F0562_031475 [Nyssa sinensis]
MTCQPAYEVHDNYKSNPSSGRVKKVRPRQERENSKTMVVARWRSVVRGIQAVKVTASSAKRFSKGVESGDHYSPSNLAEQIASRNIRCGTRD